MGRDIWTDAEVLRVLDLMEGEGLSAAEVAQRFNVGHNAICGLMFRIHRDLAASEAAPGPKATKPGNQDGALGRGWWKAGAARQGRVAPPALRAPKPYGQRQTGLGVRRYT